MDPISFERYKQRRNEVRIIEAKRIFLKIRQEKIDRNLKNFLKLEGSLISHPKEVADSLNSNFI